LTGELLYHIFLDTVSLILAGYLAVIKWRRYKETGWFYLRRLSIIFTIFALIILVDTILDVTDGKILEIFETIRIKHLMITILLLLLIWGFRPAWKRPLKREIKERKIE
jgi:hypothetical protein